MEAEVGLLVGEYRAALAGTERLQQPAGHHDARAPATDRVRVRRLVVDEHHPGRTREPAAQSPDLTYGASLTPQPKTEQRETQPEYDRRRDRRLHGDRVDIAPVPRRIVLVSRDEARALDRGRRDET